MRIGFEYRGWTVVWTGWKEDQATPHLFGQWWAFKKNPDGTDGPHMLYASVPGFQGRFRKFDHFDISIQENQRPITWATPLQIANEAYADGYNRIVALINAEEGEKED